MSQSSRSAAFTLIELAIVLMIVSLLMGGTLTLLMRYMESQQEARTRQTIAVIKQALINYRTLNDRLPCPAAPALVITSISFGVQDGDPDCNNMMQISTNSREGVVPVRTLGLPDAFMFDGWGNRITYAVDKRYIVAAAFTSRTISSVTGNLVIRDVDNEIRTSIGLVVLVSHGKNGHGAYNKGGSVINASSANSSELENCNCDASATEDPAPSQDRVYRQHAYLEDEDGDTTTYDPFDDIVEYMVRQQLRNNATE